MMKVVVGVIVVVGIAVGGFVLAGANKDKSSQSSGSVAIAAASDADGIAGEASAEPVSPAVQPLESAFVEQYGLNAAPLPVASRSMVNPSTNSHRKIAL